MNLRLLKEKIAQSGMKKRDIACELGISLQSINRKLRGVTRFNSHDALKLCEILRLENFSERIDIFLSHPFQK